MPLGTPGLRFASVLLALGPACAEPTPGTPPTSAATGTSEMESEPSTVGSAETTVVQATVAETTAADTGDGACEPVTLPLPNPEQPVGVVLLVDNSAGMGEEAAEVSARLGTLAGRLGARVEVTFVMISAYPTDDPQGVCVAPPLGNGGCPVSDEQPPAYLHIGLPVTPLAALSQVFVTYEQWATALPEGAKRQLVVVSDGETGVAVEDFREGFIMLDPERNASHRVHVSVAHTACPQAATPGEQWRAHAAASGGYDHDLCTEDYETFFEELGTRIIDDLGDRCRWVLPAIPEGVELHPDRVELLVDADGLLTSFARVGSEAECDAAVPGWYWEDPAAPAAMHACPATCTLLLDFTAVESSVRFGCPDA
jgi:hypothetical protein